MKDAKQGDDETKQNAGAGRKGRTALWLIFAIVLLALSSTAAAYVLVPSVADTVAHLIGSPSAASAGAPAASHPQMVDVPEMVVTVPNGGRPRQLRIKFSIELAQTAPALPPMEVLTPRVYDALLIYLRTLRDGDIEGSLAVDRVRGDIYRRLTLVLGPGVLQNVLITSLVTS